MMMTKYGICPSCGSHIPEHRHDENWVLCECGWLGSNNTAKHEATTQKKTITRIIILSFIIFTGFVHTARWGNDALDIIPLQAQVLLEVANPDQVLTYAELALKHHMPEESNYYLTRWAESQNTPEAWEKVALLRTRMKTYEDAVVAYGKFYELKGDNPLTLFHYAQVLEELNRPDLAEKLYVYIVGLDKQKYQRTVVEELVKLLVAQERFKEAKKVLSQLSLPHMELPSHLVRQKEWLNQLIEEEVTLKKPISAAI